MHFFKNFGNHIGTAATTYVPRDVPKRYPPDFPMKKNRVGNRIITTYETKPNIMDTQILSQEKVSTKKIINKQTNK